MRLCLAISTPRKRFLFVITFCIVFRETPKCFATEPCVTLGSARFSKIRYFNQMDNLTILRARSAVGEFLLTIQFIVHSHSTSWVYFESANKKAAKPVAKIDQSQHFAIIQSGATSHEWELMYW